jgi:hypothetical protein
MAPGVCYANNAYVNYDVQRDGNDWVIRPTTNGSNVLQALRSVDWSIELSQAQPEINSIDIANYAYPIDPGSRQMMFTHATTLDQYMQLTHWTDLADDYVTSSILNEPNHESAARVPADVNASYILRAYSGGFANDPTNTVGFVFGADYSQPPFLGPDHNRVALAQNILNAVVNLISDYAPTGFTSSWTQDVVQTIDGDLVTHNLATGLSWATSWEFSRMLPANLFTILSGKM